MTIIRTTRINQILATGRAIVNEAIVAGNAERAALFARDMVRYAREKGLLLAIQLEKRTA